MPNRLDLPPELASLIEKREQQERRQQDASAKDASAEDASASPEADEATPNEERRSGADRRANES